MFPNDDIFIDQAKPKAKKWREENDKKLIECHLIILIITPAALQSNEVKREIKIANEMKKLILPCKMNLLNLEWEELKWGIESLDGISFKDDEDLRTSLFGEVSKIRNEYYMSENISGLSFDPITVNVDKQTYSDGDTIVISGQVKELLPNTPVSLRIVSPNGQLITIAQLEISSDKKYHVELTAGRFLMNNEGTYTVTVLYGNQSRTANTTFNFKGTSGVSKSIMTENKITVEGSNSAINYSIQGGKIISVVNDSGISSLIVNIDPIENGKITLTIPRSLLDARLDDKDNDFFVLVDGEEIVFDELKTDTERTLTIAFSLNSKEIEIIGLPNSSKTTSPIFTQPQSSYEQTRKIHTISISVSFDRTVYPLNSKLYIRVTCPDIIFGKPINFQIFNSNNEIIKSKQINPITYSNSKLKQAGLYQISFKMNNHDWKVGETYTVRAVHGDAVAEDTCTVDERTPVIQTDKSVYLWGSDIIVTVIDPDGDKDSNKAELVGNRQDSYLTISSSQGTISRYKLRETGDSTGIFQGIIGIIGAVGKKTVRPYKLGNRIITKNQGKGIDDGFLKVERGGEIIFTYSNKKSTVELHAFASNFGASIELNKKIYDYNDKVYLTIVAPDYNFNSNKVDFIGHVPESQIKIKTSKGIIPFYKLRETNKDTGIFTGEFMLKPFESIKNKHKSFRSRTGPTNGIIPTSDDDLLEVTLNFFGGEIIVGKAIIKKLK